MESSSSNSSNQNPQQKYHVFLSFRGEDTRNGFADHLFAALKQNGILTFRDDEELERGEVIKQELVHAIRESYFAIVILSPNYPSSTWCLDELQEILESRKAFGRRAFPVFYGVDPSHVRHQKASFAEIFKKHEEKFGQNDIKVQKWREALTEIANLSGWDSRSWREVKLIEEIVQKICTELQPLLLAPNDELIGIDSKIEKIYSLLRVNEMNDVRFIGIWGIGGVGKTTLAKVVYERIKDQFDGSCFLGNVREVSEAQGLLELQRKVLSELTSRGMEIKDLYDGKKIISNLLCNRRILLILDDVSAFNQLENLVGNQKWFSQGSRVIVTTRDKQLMKTFGNEAFENFKVGPLDQSESLQLFFQKAFKGDQPKEEYFELSKSVVQYVGGLPLALNVLGSFLCERSIPEWKEALNMIKQHPHNDIMKTLRLSYDRLECPYKTIFLDIACFFKGWDRNHVTHILQICGHHPTIGIEVLIEKSLVTCEGQILGMHDLLQDMGKNIVFHESPNDACGRSRLWSIEHIDDVLAKNTENKTIQGIVLNSSEPYEGHWNLEAFSKISNLKLLILRTSLHSFIGLNCLSNALRVIEWMEYPLESLPPSIQLNNLVDLKLHYSKIKQLWSGIKFFQKLKFIDLSHSKYLTQTPNVSGVPCLETMVLRDCINLLEVHQSIAQHKKLVILSFEGCLNLKTLPKKLEMSSLKKFILSGCFKIKKLPEFGDDMESLSVLDLKDCKNLLCLPNSIHNLKSLKILNIFGCAKFSRMPNNLSDIKALEVLDIRGTAIKEVPSFIIHLKNLQKLFFCGCKGSPSNSWDLTRPFRWFHEFWGHQNSMSLVLSSISQMSMLRELELSYCNLGDGSFLENLGNLSSLRRLNLQGSNLGDGSFLENLGNLSSLMDLNLQGCNLGDGSFLENLGNLSSLWYLNLQGNKFVNLPTHSIASLSKLQILLVSGCARLQSLSMLPLSLQILGAAGCASMDFVSYLQQVHHLVASQVSDCEWVNGWFGHLSIAGSEIPTWFDNQNYCCNDFLISAFPESFGRYDSIVSIIVDIPHHSRLSKYWGIALCLALEYTSPSHSFLGLQSSFDSVKGFILWICKAPEADFPDKPFHLFRRGYAVEESNYPLLLFAYISREDVKKNMECDKDPFELIFCSSYSKYEGKEKCKLKIRKCGYRLMWKDDVEMRSNALTETKRRQQDDGVEEDDGTVSISNPRSSKQAKLL